MKCDHIQQHCITFRLDRIKIHSLRNSGKARIPEWGGPTMIFFSSSLDGKKVTLNALNSIFWCVFLDPQVMLPPPNYPPVLFESHNQPESE